MGVLSLPGFFIAPPPFNRGPSPAFVRAHESHDRGMRTGGQQWISRLALDSYDRELERYGGPRGLELCEDVFHADSTAVRQLLSVPGHPLTDLLVASTAELLAGLGLDPGDVEPIPLEQARWPGYAGGILSAAVDGIRVAEAVALSLVGQPS